VKLYGEFTTQEEIDAQYDLESVLDMAPYIKWLVEGSAQARGELECHLDVRFGPTIDETVDIFPARRPDAPVLVFIHGGWWRLLSSKDTSDAAAPVGVAA
jgi:arylformamidase